MNRQSWTSHEDEVITRLVDEYGLDDWTRIASRLREQCHIVRRTGKQCRERWYNHLSPAVSKQPWSSEEQCHLFQLHRQHGNRWKDISRHLTGRTDNDIKNHFYSTLRRSLRRLNKILGEKNSTVQMRQIKPSVLSTIMSCIYEQKCSEEQKFSQLQDLPSLIFDFANFKPIKTNLLHSRTEDARQNISKIFDLINRSNVQYQEAKTARHINKVGRGFCKRRFSLAETVPTPQQHQQEGLHKTNTSLQEQFKIQDHLDHYCMEHFGLDGNEDQKMGNEEEEVSLNHNISLSLDDDEVMYSMQEPEQPSNIAEQWLDLTIVGHHLSPLRCQLEFQQQIAQECDELF